MQTIPAATREQVIDACRRVYDRLKNSTIRPIHDSEGPVLFISDTYPGTWLEHTFDPVTWANLTGDTGPAVAHTRMFLRHQTPEGQLPCFFFGGKVGYSQLQENVSFARLCYEVYEKTGDRAYLAQAYEGCAKWDTWLCRHRMGVHGLIELHWGFDDGHDNSARFLDLKYRGNLGDDHNAAEKPEGCAVAPLVAPDINAVFYGGRMALADMADALGRPREAENWRERAETIRQKLIRLCWNEDDEFFYDVDKTGNQRKIRSIAITQLFQEKLLEQEMADRIFDRYFRDPGHFATPIPWSGLSVSDPLFKKRIDGNDWGYFAQSLVMLRTTRWMAHYGYEKELRENMQIWLDALIASPLPFTQELDPISGAPSVCAHWFSSTMLLFLTAAKALGYIDDRFFA